MGTLRKEFVKVLEWLNSNKLIINLQKTHLMLFTNRKRPQSINITVNGHVIQEKTEIKFLGVIVDNQLNWHAHVNYISNKISKSVAILRILRGFFPKHILKTLYLTLIYPYFNYCNIIWGTAYTSTLRPLTILQKKSVRLICNAEFREHTAPLFKSTKILTLNQMHTLNCAKFIYNCYNSNTYINFKDRLIQNSQIHHYNTRNREDLRPPYARLQISLNSFMIKGITIWNKLPDNIKQAHTIAYYKSKFKKLLLESNDCL